MSTSCRGTLASGAAVVAVAGCRPHPVTSAATPARVAEEYCFWTAFRTTLPPDSVVARYIAAFAQVGLGPTVEARLADTTWAHAGPTVLTRPEGRATYAARVVAYQRGDVTMYRAFVSIGALPGSPATGEERWQGAGGTIPFCGALSAAAQAHGTTGGEPGTEEARAVWRPRP